MHPIVHAEDNLRLKSIQRKNIWGLYSFNLYLHNVGLHSPWIHLFAPASFLSTHDKKITTPFGVVIFLWIPWGLHILGRSEFRLRQGFGFRPKHLYGAKAPPARRLLQRNAESFSYAYAKLKATFWSCTAGLKCSLFFYKTSIILAFTQCNGGFVMFK